jgi:hypothetical protein
MRQSSGGLIDPDYLGWHGVSDPYGKRLGKSLFRGTNKFIAPDPAVALPYAAALEGHRHKGMGDSYISADMLAGEMQVKKNLDIDYNARAISGHTGDRLHQPVYGPHKGTESINASVKQMREFQRSLSDYLKRDGREFDASGIHYLDWDNAPPNLRKVLWNRLAGYEAVARGTRPGGEYTYLPGGHGDIFDARTADMVRARQQNAVARRNWLKQMSQSRAVQDMQRRGYLDPSDLRRFMPKPGVQFDIRPGDTGNWPKYLRSLGGGRFE